jgi:glycosyltransferase involved in cell wall biosynthesis
MISVITPVFNGERFIESCILNVINQNCQTYEHIIIDGGSTDGTISIIEKYSAEYPNIIWSSQKDRGQSDAMNKGVAMANGEIIGFLNVDDYYEPGVLNRVSEIFPDLPEPSLIVGNCNVWDNDGNLLYVNKPSKLNIRDLLMGNDINPHPVNPSAYFYHKSLHNKIGNYDINENFALDVDFLFRAVQVANIEYFNELWGNYRFLEGTKTYCDQASKMNKRRMKKLYNKFLKEQPFKMQLYILFTSNFLFFSNLVNRGLKKYFRN